MTGFLTPTSHNQRQLLDPVEDIEVGRHERGHDGEGAQEMTNQHDRQDYNKPASDGALDDILLLGGLGGKRKALHQELKYRAPELESMPVSFNQ